MMAGAMAFYVQVIGLDDQMEEQASRVVKNLGLLLSPVPVSESQLCEQAKSDVAALRTALDSSGTIPMNFFTVFELYVTSYDCVVEYSDTLPEGQ